MKTKKIHVAWPVFCQVELENVKDMLERVLGMVNYRGSGDVLVLAMKSVIFAQKEAQEALEQAYGK